MILHPYRSSYYMDNLFSPLIKYKEFDRFFDSLFEPIVSPPYYNKYRIRERESFYVEENEKEVNIIGILPKNFNKDLIKIELEKTDEDSRVLHIRIKYNHDKKDHNGRVIKTYQSEMNKSYHLDSNSFEFSNITAKIENGRLYINLPRREEDNNKGIEIPIQYITNEKEEDKEQEEDKMKEEIKGVDDKKEKVQMNDHHVKEEENSLKASNKGDELNTKQQKEEEIAIVSDISE